MVQLARVETSDPVRGTRTVLAARILSSSFARAEIRSYFDEMDFPLDAHHYLDISGLAPTVVSFLELGQVAVDAVNTRIKELTGADLEHLSNVKQLIFYDEVDKVLSPLDGRTEVGKFLCVGMNYVDHCAEQNLKVPEVPLIFSKFGSNIVGPGDPVPLYAPSPEQASGGATHGGLSPDGTERIVTSKVDYEVELGVVVGRTVPRFSSPADAAACIGGYTVVHDVSARDLQLESNGGQWLLGKAGDGYAPIGPVVVTLDEILEAANAKEGADPDVVERHAGANDLGIRCRVNGVTLQDSSTSNLVHSVPAVLSYISKFMTLHPGDVVSTGTPPGVGCFRKPKPLWLKAGDVVECEIDGIGTLHNPVVGQLDEKAPSVGATTAAATEPAVWKKTETTKEEASTAGGASAGNDSVGGIGRGKFESRSNVDMLMEKVATIAVGIAEEEEVKAATEAVPFVKPIRLEGTSCLVTGAARGIGYGIALRLALEGAISVAVVDLEKTAVDDAAESLADELSARSPLSNCAFHGMACDVTNLLEVERVWADAAEVSGTGRLDVLVQSAGIVGQTNVKTEHVNPDDFDAVMNVNVKGIFYGCRAALPIMTKSGYGRIVNIASIAGKEGNAGMLAYSTSKAAVIGLTKTIGKEYAGSGVTVNALAPAVVRTKMVEDMPDTQVKYMTDKIPMKRCGDVEEIAATIAFIASGEAGFTTGFCFDATGGRAVY